MTVLDTGCERFVCSLRGVRYGAQLFLALIAFALVGSAAFKGAGLAMDWSRAPGLIVASLAGLVVMMTYVYVRSILHAGVPFLPLTGIELWIVVVACAFYLVRPKFHKPDAFSIALPPAGEWAWLLIRLGLLATICLVVADRELPRLIMLSSDPDTHAFLAKQVERMGGIYWSQGAWGSEPLGYPGGSATMIYVWASLSFLDVGNALAALPLLLSLVASMAVGEALALRTAKLPNRIVLLVTAVGITCAGFLFPLYTRFSHLEGAGRLVSIAAIALLVVLALHQGSHELVDRRRVEHRLAPFGMLALFVLAALNPINVLVPSVLIAAYAMQVLVRERRLTWWLLAPLSCPLLLMMDPYYWGIMTGRVSPEKLTIVGDYARLSAPAIFEAWVHAASASFSRHVWPLLVILPEHRSPIFAQLLSVLTFGWLAAGWKPVRSVVGPLFMVTLVLAGLFLVTTLLRAVATDSRMYLMSAYFPFSTAQFKFMLLLSLSLGLVSKLGEGGGSIARLGLTAGLLMCLCMWTLRTVQPMHLAPRHAYCGSMGCVQPTDIEIVKKLEALVAEGDIPLFKGKLPRVLIPNVLVNAGIERWVFPTGASRYLAMADALPVAFYYYQGDSDYTTENYKRYVCEQLDRDWLAKEGIDYVFLPAERVGTCIAGLESLHTTDTVILKSGSSYLVRFNSANH